ncbi:hypothetical protein [Streptomyces sp. TLI_146]|uniref:hypothetical protein n=1 Tax=Streptomyces sp. TLI_146 TaxID=1938858 RepID=UPI00214CB300|nr:hypothetical protein [Streptomyces sp. TLI_146]
MGASLAGCSGGTAAEDRSAGQMLDEANATMKALTSVTIDVDTTVTAGEGYSSHMVTDLKDRCISRATWATGAGLEQIRINGADYVRPNRAYLHRWSGRFPVSGQKQNRWIKASSAAARAGDGLAECTQEFASFGEATKGEPVKVNGSPAISLVVTDKADAGGSYTFYVADKGKPYILKVVYKGAKYHGTTTFSAFDQPLDVRPPAKTDVVDASALGR